MSRITHFEIQASQPQALMDFYSAVLGWKFTKWESLDYWLITTGPAGEPGIDGGLQARPTPPPPADGQIVNAYVCTADVVSLDDTLAAAMARGASEALPKMPVPGVGWLAYIKDPDGNVLGLMQRDEKAAM